MLEVLLYFAIKLKVNVRSFFYMNPRNKTIFPTLFSSPTFGQEIQLKIFSFSFGQAPLWAQLSSTFSS